MAACDFVQRAPFAGHFSSIVIGPCFLTAVAAAGQFVSAAGVQKVCTSAERHRRTHLLLTDQKNTAPAATAV